MTTLVFDSTPLIHLSKVKILEKVSELKSIKLIPSLVYQEVIIGSEERDDATYLNCLVEKGIFKVVEVKEIIKNLPTVRLSDADIQVLSLTKERKCLAVMDEETGRRVAEQLNIETIGSAGILFALLKQKIITTEEFRTAFNNMVDNGWFCSAALYSYVIEEMERISANKRT
jgi:predicted nucleic acid-binding protein